jgi:hypothetical protein
MNVDTCVCGEVINYNLTAMRLATKLIGLCEAYGLERMHARE